MPKRIPEKLRKCRQEWRDNNLRRCKEDYKEQYEWYCDFVRKALGGPGDLKTFSSNDIGEKVAKERPELFLNVMVGYSDGTDLGPARFYMAYIHEFITWK